jgi:dihydrofolate reductase
VRKALAKQGYDLVYVSAPISVKLADLPFDSSKVGGNTDDGTLRSWWPNSESDPDYYSLDFAFSTIRTSIEESGPFIGVLGFSQGAALAGILCQHIHNLHDSQPPLQFGILYSGFRLVKPEHQQFYKTKITVPTVHVVGTLDTVVSEERSLALWDACNESTRFMISHPGGHYVPSAKYILQDITSWISQLTLSTRLRNEGAPDSPNEWDEFDKIGAL